MTTLHFFKNEDVDKLNYVLDEVQQNFTASASQALYRIKQRNEIGDFEAFPITILYENAVVGFFVLDFGSDKFELTENLESVLIRSLSINPIFQGKGIGVSAMKQIPKFLNQNFPQRNIQEIVLAVNNANTSAYQLYCKVGYSDTGKTKKWKDGFQHFLSMKITTETK